MNRQFTRLSLPALIALAPAAVQATVIPTSFGAGADAEVRDHQSTTNFGASTELATRILDNAPTGSPSDGSDRFSAMYLKFDIAGQFLPVGQPAQVRLTYRNTNLTPNRLTDTNTPNPDFRTGIAFYGLDRDNIGNSWTENTITYATAPGIVTDGDNGTKDYDFTDPDGGGPLRAPLVPLGVALFPPLGTQNHLPVGGEMLFSSNNLTAFINQSLNANKPTVTIVASIVHDGKVPVNDWKNFNYLFNPKELTTLLSDPSYDSDTTNPSNPLGAPFSGASNATQPNGFSPFSPQLILVPEPTGLALLALGGVGLLARRKR